MGRINDLFRQTDVGPRFTFQSSGERLGVFVPPELFILKFPPLGNGLPDPSSVLPQNNCGVASWKVTIPLFFYFLSHSL